MQTLDGDANNVIHNTPEEPRELVDAIQAAVDTPLTPVPVPEWGVTVWVRTLSAGEGAELAGYVLELGDDAPDGAVRMLVLSATLSAADGRLLFRSSDHAASVLDAKSNAVVTRLFNRAQELNGFGREEMEQAEGN